MPVDFEIRMFSTAIHCQAETIEKSLPEYASRMDSSFDVHRTVGSEEETSMAAMETERDLSPRDTM